MKRRMFLTASVLLNLLFAGAFAGYLISPAPIGWHSIVDPAVKSLPMERQKFIESSFENIHQDIYDKHQEFCAARDSAVKLLEAEPFSSSAYLEQMQQVQKLRNQIGSMVAIRLAELSNHLTREERQVLARIAVRLTLKDYTVSTAADAKISCEFKIKAN